jgi:hypothetical protein
VAVVVTHGLGAAEDGSSNSNSIIVRLHACENSRNFSIFKAKIKNDTESHPEHSFRRSLPTPQLRWVRSLVSCAMTTSPRRVSQANPDSVFAIIPTPLIQLQEGSRAYGRSRRISVALVTGAGIDSSRSKKRHHLSIFCLIWLMNSKTFSENDISLGGTRIQTHGNTGTHSFPRNKDKCR